MSILLNNMPQPLDRLHKIIEDLQHCFKPCQESQLELRYANISYLPKSEGTQKLENSQLKPCHAKITYHGGIVSHNVKIFQKYINQSLEQQNPSMKENC